MSIIVAASLSFVSPLFGGHRAAPRLAETVELPVSYEMDLSLGAKQRSDILARGSELADDPNARTGAEVFKRLVNVEMISGLGLPYQWRFVEVNSPIINASSTADGEIAADAGLVKVIGNDPGLWAAVLSHEITHTARRHIVRQVLFRMYIQEQVEYWQRRQILGDKSAGWVVLGLRVAGPIAEKKLSRSLEHEADVQGMLLMARAGYHPDYVFALHHLLRMETGEQSKFAAFFSDHPRWVTRDQRNDKAYSEALEEYARLWPDPSASPGGAPPPVAFLADTKSSENKRLQSADIRLALSCRNVTSPVRLHIRFSTERGGTLAAPLAQYADSAGNLNVSQPAICLDKDDGLPTTVHIPASLIRGSERKVKAKIDVVAPEGQVLEQSKEIELRLPKGSKTADSIAEVQVDPPVSDDVLTKVNSPTAPQPRISAENRGPLPRPADGANFDRNAATTVAMANISVPESQTRRTSLTAAPKDASHDSWNGSGDPEIRHTQQLIATWWTKAAEEQTIPAYSNLSSQVPVLIMSTPKLTFPPQPVNSSSASATVTVTNGGPSVIEILNIRVVEKDGDDFHATNTCGQRVTAKASCTVTVWFTPLELGLRRAAIALYDQENTPQIVLLEGIGTGGPSLP